MNTAEITIRHNEHITRQPAWQHRLVSRAFAGIKYGHLNIRLNDGTSINVCGQEQGPAANITFHAPASTLLRVWWRGDIGFAESYMAGQWETSDLSQLMYLLSKNLEALEQLDKRSRVQKWLSTLKHWLNSNTLRGSRRNISAHYDLGNDFYSRWLDDSMTYSSALFANTSNLEVAQMHKYDAILDRLDAKPGDHILEIGCGWGAFAEHAARRGFLVTGITLSREQLAYARKRIHTSGLDDRVYLQLMDYRKLEHQFDHIVSIEMIEAVGQQYWQTYFDKLKTCLKPGGNIVIQSITIDESDFDQYSKNPGGFIQQYIFPGGMLPTREHLKTMASNAGLKILDTMNFGQDYATTLAAWHEKFNRQESWLEENGYDQKFRRMWQYYLSFCEGGFRDERIDVVHVHYQHA